MIVEWHLPAELVLGGAHSASPLPARIAGRLLPMLVGLLFAQGRKTVAACLRAVGVGKDFRLYSYCLGRLGRAVEIVASLLLRRAATVVDPGPRVVLAMDDTPTKRQGPQVEGAGIHHNPTPGSAGQKFLYGHIWVTLAWVVRHPLWGAIGLPLRALLYVRQKDVALLTRWYKVAFQTKLQQAATLVQWAADWLRFLGKSLWVVADGAYATPQTILEAVADRNASEQDFKDVKEVHGAGQQQLRHYWANVAAYHLCLWLYTLVELWAWPLPARQLCDRRRSPWDDPTRRPSHADRRNAFRRRGLEGELRAAQRRPPVTRKIRGVFRRR